MCHCSRTMYVLNFLVITSVFSAPSISRVHTRDSSSSIETSLEQFLSSYYDEYVRKQGRVTEKVTEDIYDTMQGDQPAAENNLRQTEPSNNGSGRSNNSFADSDYIRAMKDRAKENWIEILKENILRQMGRENSTIPKRNVDTKGLSLESIPSFLNTTNTISDDQITEKIRGFYPSCEIPINTDQDLWKNDDVMNLYFNYEYVPEDRSTNIATATLRLYRIPENATKHDPRSPDCDYPVYNEDEKLLRVSVYWYTKSLKKRRVKRRLSDSKVVSEGSKWVELSVKPATRAWSKGKNLGLGVVVEDQDGNTLRADRCFKGATCMVGTSTPKPIPTIIIDAAQRTNELDQISSLLGRNSTSALHSDVHLLPTIDICTLEFPENYSQPEHITNLRINACNLKKIHEQSQRSAEKERLERLKTLPEFLVPSSRHIRHQRQHLANKMNEEGANRGFDPRSRIEGATILIRHDELQNFTQKKFNFSMINR